VVFSLPVAHLRALWISGAPKYVVKHSSGSHCLGSQSWAELLWVNWPAATRKGSGQGTFGGGAALVAIDGLTPNVWGEVLVKLLVEAQSFATLIAAPLDLCGCYKIFKRCVKARCYENPAHR
jgi:hypothetical protein